jgi:hypothetical protein
MKLRKMIETEVEIGTPMKVTPASSEFTVTLDNYDPISSPSSEDLLILPVAEVMEDDRMIRKSLSSLWSNEDDSPVLGVISPKR